MTEIRLPMMPRIEDQAEDGETFAAGFTPTKSGSWVSKLLVQPEVIDTEA